MKKNVEAVVSAMGVLLSIVVGLVKLIKDRGGEVGACFYHLGTAEGAVALERIAKIMVEARGIYHVLVNYSQPLADAIATGKYDYVNPNITQDNFPKTKTGEENVPVELLHFGRFISTPDALAEIEKQGYRPAVIEELLALGKSQPELQRQFPIVALGSVAGLVGVRYAPCLGRGGVGRSLGLDPLRGGWRGGFRFAVVRLGPAVPASV